MLNRELPGIELLGMNERPATDGNCSTSGSLCNLLAATNARKTSEFVTRKRRSEELAALGSIAPVAPCLCLLRAAGDGVEQFHGIGDIVQPIAGLDELEIGLGLLQ